MRMTHLPLSNPVLSVHSLITPVLFRSSILIPSGSLRIDQPSLAHPAWNHAAMRASVKDMTHAEPGLPACRIRHDAGETIGVDTQNKQDSSIFI